MQDKRFVWSLADCKQMLKIFDKAIYATRFTAGRRNFDRCFSKATGNKPIEYLQRLTIESAIEVLETMRNNINELMYDVGYADVEAFRDVFKKITIMSPLEHRNRYNKEAMVS